MADAEKVRAVLAGFQQDPTSVDIARICMALTGQDSPPAQLEEIARILAEPTTWGEET